MALDNCDEVSGGRVIKYASIIVADCERGKRWCIGVIAQNGVGEIRIRIAEYDRLVQSTPQFRSMEEHYNRVFQEGEASFYKRDPDEMASHVEVIKTADPQFLEKYDAGLAEDKKIIRLWNIREYRGNENIDDIIDGLLAQVRREFAG